MLSDGYSSLSTFPVKSAEKYFCRCKVIKGNSFVMFSSWSVTNTKCILVYSVSTRYTVQMDKRGKLVKNCS